MAILTLKQAAERAGIDPSTLRHAIRDERLQAVKFGRDWAVTENEIIRYMVSRKSAPARPISQT